jgi:hypothetical protein
MALEPFTGTHGDLNAFMIGTETGPVTLIRLFLEHLGDRTLSPKTIQNHIHNMWLLGREFIRDLHKTLLFERDPWIGSFSR